MYCCRYLPSEIFDDFKYIGFEQYIDVLSQGNLLKGHPKLLKMATNVSIAIKTLTFTIHCIKLYYIVIVMMKNAESYPPNANEFEI